MDRELHVAKTGNDTNTGTPANPLLTISRAAVVAEPGDTVVVHAGVYREWVKPRYGANSSRRAFWIVSRCSVVTPTSSA